MASSSLPSSVIELVDRAHQSNDAKTSKSPYSVTLSELKGALSSSRDAFRDTTQNDEEPLDNPEFKLPSWRSLFVIIGGNALFQVLLPYLLTFQDF